MALTCIQVFRICNKMLNRTPLNFMEAMFRSHQNNNNLKNWTLTVWSCRNQTLGKQEGLELLIIVTNWSNFKTMGYILVTWLVV